jgi:hypothetical protein
MKNNLLFFLILILILILLLICHSIKEQFGFSSNFLYPQHLMNKEQRRNYDLSVEDENLMLNCLRKTTVLRDVSEIMNFKSDSKDIYDLTRVKKNRVFTDQLGFW